MFRSLLNFFYCLLFLFLLFISDIFLISFHSVKWDEMRKEKHEIWRGVRGFLFSILIVDCTWVHFILMLAFPLFLSVNSHKIRPIRERWRQARALRDSWRFVKLPKVISYSNQANTRFGNLVYQEKFCFASLNPISTWDQTLIPHKSGKKLLLKMF